jgi:hypothetical protein
MEILSVNFYTFIRPNHEQLREMQLYVRWQESNLRPWDHAAITGLNHAAITVWTTQPSRVWTTQSSRVWWQVKNSASLQNMLSTKFVGKHAYRQNAQYKQNIQNSHFLPSGFIFPLSLCVRVYHLSTCSPIAILSKSTRICSTRNKNYNF